MKPTACLVAFGILSSGALTACDATQGLTGSKSEKTAKAEEDDDDDAKESKKKKKKKKAEDDEESASAEPVKVPAPKSNLDPFVEQHLALVRTAASCDDKANAIAAWCMAANEFGAASPAEVPPTSTRLGVTTFVVTKDASKATLEKFMHLSSLAIRRADPGFALISEVKPDNDAERADTNRVAGLVFQHFAGRDVKLGAGEAMSGYLDGLAARASYPLTKHDNGYRVVGGSNADLRRIGKAWVSIEVPKNDPAGIWLSVFADLPYR